MKLCSFDVKNGLTSSKFDRYDQVVFPGEVTKWYYGVEVSHNATRVQVSILE